MQHFRLVGMAVVYWGKLEAVLQDIIWRLLGVDLADGRVITARLDVRPKIEMIEALISRRVIAPHLTAELLDVLDLVQNRQRDRNFIVHASWATLTPHWTPIATSLREKTDEPSQILSETFPDWQMREIINDIMSCVRRAIAVLDALPPSIDKSPAPDPMATENPPPSPSPRPKSKRPRQPKPSRQ
jgi:hypothetical protein